MYHILTIIAVLFIAGCGDVPPDNVALNNLPGNDFPTIDPDDRQSLTRWEQSRYNINDSKLIVAKVRYFHGTLGNNLAKELKSVTFQVGQAKKTGLQPAQQSAMDDFLKNEATIHKAVREAIYEYYKKSYPAYKPGIDVGVAFYGGGEDVDSVLPKIITGNELDELVTLATIYVHPVTDGKTSMGIEYYVPWDDEHGLGVRLEQGKVISVGIAHEALPAPQRLQPDTSIVEPTGSISNWQESLPDCQ